jgi:hypothetical protein
MSANEVGPPREGEHPVGVAGVEGDAPTDVLARSIFTRYRGFPATLGVARAFPLGGRISAFVAGRLPLVEGLAERWPVSGMHGGEHVRAVTESFSGSPTSAWGRPDDRWSRRRPTATGATTEPTPPTEPTRAPGTSPEPGASAGSGMSAGRRLAGQRGTQSGPLARTARPAVTDGSRATGGTILRRARASRGSSLPDGSSERSPGEHDTSDERRAERLPLRSETVGAERPRPDGPVNARHGKAAGDGGRARTLAANPGPSDPTAEGGPASGKGIGGRGAPDAERATRAAPGPPGPAVRTPIVMPPLVLRARRSPDPSASGGLAGSRSAGDEATRSRGHAARQDQARDPAVDGTNRPAAPPDGARVRPTGGTASPAARSATADASSGHGDPPTRSGPTRARARELERPRGHGGPDAMPPVTDRSSVTRIPLLDALTARSRPAGPAPTIRRKTSDRRPERPGGSAAGEGAWGRSDMDGRAGAAAPGRRAQSREVAGPTPAHTLRRSARPHERVASPSFGATAGSALAGAGVPSALEQRAWTGQPESMSPGPSERSNGRVFPGMEVRLPLAVTPRGATAVIQRATDGNGSAAAPSANGRGSSGRSGGQSPGRGTPRRPSGSDDAAAGPEVDVEEVAEAVYRLIGRRLQVERERRGLRS